MKTMQFGNEVDVRDFTNGEMPNLLATGGNTVVDAPVRNLEVIVGGDPFVDFGTMARAVGRWAGQRGYLSGFWNGEQANYPSGEGHVVGVVLIAR